jgi:hypothetical protein
MWKHFGSFTLNVKWSHILVTKCGSRTTNNGCNSRLRDTKFKDGCNLLAKQSGLPEKTAGRDAGPTMNPVGPASVPVIKWQH